ncbi:MAG: flagellar protein FliT [Burkholderiaceae bacterium]
MATGGPAAPGRLIEYYETVATISRAMRAAACEGDAAGFERLADECRDRIASLQSAARSQSLAYAERGRRMELLRSILEDDAEIRRRVEPSLARLEQWLAPGPSN